MKKELHILILEDNSADAELMEHELLEAGIIFSAKRVEIKDAFIKELENSTPDIILTDYKLPGFDGFSALAIAKIKYPDVPVIFVTGALGEEMAVEILKKGATDYILKHRLSHLAPAVHRALREVEERAERKRAEEKVIRLNRVYFMLSGINQTIIRIHDRKKLFEEACRIAVELGLFRMAWIGTVDGDSLLVKPVAHWELEKGYLDNIQISATDVPGGCGSVGRAILKGECFICNDIEHDQRMLPWRDEAIKHGYRSSAAFPLRVGKRVVGAFNFYANEPHFFDDEEVHLLKELAADISFALESIEKEEQRMRAEEQLKESLKEKEILLREIHHRVKNNMQIISSLLMLQEELSKDEKVTEMLKDSQNRITSMALIHEKLYRSENLSKIDLNEYIDDLVSSLFQSYGVSESKVALNINVENVLLGIDTAIPCGLIINELISNSLKHAFPECKNGEIKISLRSTDENMIELLIGDNGVGIPKGVDFRKTESLGLHLVNILVENQLHGEIQLNRDKETEFKIKFRGLK